MQRSEINADSIVGARVRVEAGRVIEEGRVVRATFKRTRGLQLLLGTSIGGMAVAWPVQYVTHVNGEPVE